MYHPSMVITESMAFASDIHRLYLSCKDGKTFQNPQSGGKSFKITHKTDEMVVCRFHYLSYFACIYCYLRTTISLWPTFQCAVVAAVAA